MAYTELIQRLFNVNLWGGIKLELQNMERLRHLMHDPDRAFSSIHVAGTNGKGSVCIKIATAFEKAGYRVGLFTSPHISSFRERIRINRQMISEAAVESLLSELFALVDREQVPVTFFELTTLLALSYFAREKVDLAVFETGLGGRLDATNVILPSLSIITSISLDHTEILGSTQEAIALEKAGIIKEKVPVIIGPRVPAQVIQPIALAKQSPYFQVQCNSPLFEEENRSIAQAALNFLAPRFHLSAENIQQGLEEKQPCRFEILKGSPLVILDVAHNPDGLEHLFRTIRAHYPHSSLRLVCGLSKNKDVRSCLALIATHGQHFHLVEAPNGRGVPPQELYSMLQEFSIAPSSLFVHDSILTGVKQAQQSALEHHQILVICGSFFIMAQARQALGLKEPFDAIDLNERHTGLKP